MLSRNMGHIQMSWVSLFSIVIHMFVAILKSWIHDVCMMRGVDTVFTFRKLKPSIFLPFKIAISLMRQCDICHVYLNGKYHVYLNGSQLPSYYWIYISFVKVCACMKWLMCCVMHCISKWTGQSFIPKKLNFYWHVSCL